MDSLKSDGTTRSPSHCYEAMGAPKPREFGIEVNTIWETILQSCALTVGAEAIIRGLVQTPKPRLPNASQTQICWCNSFCVAIVAKKDTSNGSVCTKRQMRRWVAWGMTNRTKTMKTRRRVKNQKTKMKKSSVSNNLLTAQRAGESNWPYARRAARISSTRRPLLSKAHRHQDWREDHRELITLGMRFISLSRHCCLSQQRVVFLYLYDENNGVKVSK